jgi:hypothetical protein
MIFINLDISPILELAQGFSSTVDKAMREAVRDLTMQAHAHILENVQQKLHSTRQKYVDALGFHQVDQDTWLITLDKGAMWIEEGIKPGTSMLDGLLKSKKAKTAKDGSRYAIIPFSHKGGKTSQTTAQQDLTATIKKEMKARNIPYGNLETDAGGKPKVGLLHSFNIMNGPLKSHEGPGQGKGPVGAPRQGVTGIPFLQGVRVYQRPVQDKLGNTSVKKSIMTFRVASSKHPEKFRHPGLEARKFLDEAAAWALKEFEEHIRDQILVQVSNL